MRAGCPDASWMTRTTLLPSTTTHTASSRDQLGRDRLRPSSACDALPPSGPTHNDDAMSGAPGRSVTIDATFWPVRDTAAAVWLGICPNAPGTRGARWPSRNTSDPPINACRPAAAPGNAPGSVAATSEVSHPSANRSSSAAPSAVITYGPLIPARDNVQMICAASSWRLCGSVVDRFSRSIRAPPYPRPTPVLPPSARVTGPRSFSGGPSRLRTVLAISGRGPAISLLTSSVANWSGSDTAT